MDSVASQGCECPFHSPLLSRRCNTLTLFGLWLSMNSHMSWALWNANGHLECSMWIERSADRRYCFCRPCSCSIIPLDNLQKMNSKIKVLRILRGWKQDIKPSMGPFWAWFPMWLYMLPMRLTQPQWPHLQTGMRMVLVQLALPISMAMLIVSMITNEEWLNYEYNST